MGRPQLVWSESTGKLHIQSCLPYSIFRNFWFNVEKRSTFDAGAQEGNFGFHNKFIQAFCTYANFIFCICTSYEDTDLAEVYSSTNGEIIDSCCHYSSLRTVIIIYLQKFLSRIFEDTVDCMYIDVINSKIQC